MPLRLPHRARRTACITFVVAGCLALIGHPAAGSQEESPSLRDRVRRFAERTLEHRCLTPAVDGVFNDVVRSGAFRPALGATFRITDASSREGHIELSVAKPGGRAHSVTLSVERTVGRASDGRAGDFVFYLQPGADAEGARSNHPDCGSADSSVAMPTQSMTSPSVFSQADCGSRLKEPTKICRPTAV